MFLEALRLEELQLLGALVTPVLAGAPDQVAGGISLAHTAIFEDVDLLAGAAADVTAREPADGPARRHIRATEVQEMLLRLIGREQCHPLLGQQSVAAGLDAKQAFEGMDADTRALPLFVASPLELRVHRLRHAPAVREAEL